MTLFLHDQQSKTQYQLQADGLLSTVKDSLDFAEHALLLMDPACRIVQCSMPIKQTRQILKALPFALEDQLATDIENNHLLYLEREKEQAYSLIVEHQIMQNLPKSKSVYFLPLLLPHTNDKASILVVNQYACVRLSKLNSFSIPVNLLPLALEKHLGQEGGRIQIAYAGEKNELLEVQLENLNLNIEHMDISSTLQYIENQIRISKHNLLSGPYKIKETAKTKMPFKFKAPLILTGSVLTLLISMNWVNAAQHNQLAQQIKDASKSYYLSLFPGERVRGLRRQFADKLNEYGSNAASSAGFTTLMANSSAIIRKNESSQIQSVRYTSKKGVLEVSLLTDNIAQLDQIKQNLESNGLKVDIASANNEGGKIKGLLKVSAND